MKLHLPISLRCRLLATFLLATASIYANFSTTLFSGSIPEGYTEVIVKDAKSLKESAAEASGANVAYRLVYQDGGITVKSPAQALMPSAAGSRYFTAEQAETPASLHISKAETTRFTLDSNESLSWQALGTLSYTENTSSASGGLVYASSSAELSWIGNEKVEFVGNHASSGGAISGGNGSTITLSGNDTVSFSGNTASSYGGAIYGGDGSTITLSDNGTVTFSGNTASKGGAIYSRGNLHIRNNDSVEFAGNVEKSDSTYRLRSIYVYGGSRDVVSLSAAEGKSITFRDAMYIGSGTTVDFNADYNGLKQKGDILFTGATTEADLLAAKGSAGTAEEILNSRTTEVRAMTNLYGGRLRVEDGAVYKGYGMTAHAGADATILIKDATLDHAGYNIVMGSGSSLTLEGDNLLAGNVLLQEGSTLVLDSSSALGVNDISGSLQWSEGAQFLWHPGEDSLGANTVLLYVSEGISGWDSVQVSTGSSSYSSGDFTWVDGLLLLNYEAESFNRYFNGSASFSSTQRGTKLYHHYQELAFLDVTDGAIYGNTTLSNNGTVTFSGNTASSGYGSAIYGDHYSTFTLSDNGTVTFSGNTASSDYGGAIYGGRYSTITLSDNDTVSFSYNWAGYSGGAICGSNGSTITLSNNGEVEFSGNTASSYYSDGGAIYGGNSSTITLSDNNTVSFSWNTADSGGAIGGGRYSTITLSNNGEVEFSGNTAGGNIGAFGGAIYGGDNSTITLSNNDTVTFSGNTTSGAGGAIGGDTITLSDNGTVSFSGNTADGRGGAIGGDTITLSDNGTVSFSGNSGSYGGAIDGSTITLSDNGTVSFSGNSGSYGGAIDGGSILSNNGTVSFSGNTASGGGGAIEGSTTLSNNGTVTFSGNTARNGGAIDGGSILSNNGTVSFSGNTASYGSGGAIYSFGDLHIRNNDSVEFAGNVEKSGSTYRLRSIYVNGGSGDTVSLSAAEEKSIIFRDSMYIGSGTTVDFNADYNGQKQKGDILFTGVTTEADLLAVKGRAGTAEEILNSRTTEVLAMTNLYGGRLRVEDGAVYQGQGITVHEGSEATVRVKDATLNHKGYTLSFASGTMLELEGANSFSGDLLMKSGSSLSFVLQEATAVAGRHSGALTVQEGVELRLQLDCEDWLGTEKTLLLIASDAGSAASCAESSLRTVGVSNALWGYKDAYWQGENLFVDVRKTDTVTWDNAAGDYRWDHLSANWTDEGYRYSYVQGAHVVLGQSGEGTIRVLGNMAIAGMSVEGGSSYCLEWAEDSSLAVADYLRVDSRSSLDFGGDLSLVSVENQGHLTVAGDLTALSAISGMGQLNVAGTLTAASLQAAGLTADTLTLTEVGAQSRIGSNVSFAGDATVAGALAVEGSLSAQKVSIGGELSAATVQTSDLLAGSVQVQAVTADTLTLTESGAQSRIGSDVALRGAATVAGGLQIEGALSAASLQTESLAAESLTLTESGAQSRIGSDVSFAGDATVAGALAVEGSLSAQKVSIGGELSATTVQTSDLVAGSVQVQAVTADTLTLTESGVQNRIGSSVTLRGAATVAGGLQIEGSFSAASLQAEALTAESLTLTESGVQNRIGSSVTLRGAATVAGGLQIEGAFSAASLQAGSLSADSLTLTEAGTQSRIGSDVALSGAATVAGGLQIEGALSAASLQTEVLAAESLTLTEVGAQSRIGSNVSFAGDATVAGALAVEGSLSAQKVSIGGELSATTVQTSDLLAGSVQVQAVTADTLTLTESGAQSRIESDVSFAGDATVAGALAVEGSLSAQKVSIGGELSATTVQTSDLLAGSVLVQALTADTLMLTESGAQNRIGSNVSFAGDATVAGSLAVEGSLSEQKVSIGGELSATTVQTSDLVAGSVQVQAVTADTLTLTEAGAQSRIGSNVSFAGDATVAGALAVEGSLSAQKVSIGGELSATTVQTSDLAAGSVQVQALTADTLTLTESGAQSRIGSDVALSGAATVAGGLQIEGALSAASLQAEALAAESLTLTASGAQSRIGSDVSFAGDATVAGALAVEGSFSAQKVSIGGELSAATVQTSDLLAGSVQVQAVTADTLTLTEAGAQNRIGSDVALSGAAMVAGGLQIEGAFSAASLQAEALSAESLTLTASGTQSRIGSDVALSGAATVAGGLQIEGALSAASLQAGSLSAESLTLTDAAARNKVEGLLELRGSEVTHRVSGDLAAEMVSLAAGATLETDGVLTSSTVQMSGKVGGLTAAAFGSAEMDFVLDRKALEGLNLSHMQTATIARTGEAFAEDFSVLLNGSATESTDAAAYTYTIAGAGNEVQVTADYRWWDTRVWYRGGWVGEAEWTDHLIAGYDAVDGVETIDLGGESFAGYTLMVELEEGVSAVQVSNGALSFEYIDMFAGQLNIGPGTEVQVAELWGEGLTLSLSGEVTKLTVSEYLTVGTLAMDYATLTVKDAEVAELTGDAGSLVISEGGVVTVDSDVTLSGMRNGGSLDIGSHKLVVNGLTSEGGDVTAGEVETRSNMRTAAQFNKLVADKVTVRNSNSSTRYTDDLSVGAGSAIGELVAETLTVREGTVMLGHDERATAQELQKLTLNAATAELVLNEATSLAVTNSLSAKSGAKVQLKKDATLVYQELGIGNRQGAGMVTVDAYGLSRGATLSLEKAHVMLRSSETTELDHLLAESSVENLGSGTLKLTHADNRLTGIAATGGDVEVYNSAVSHDLQELYIASQMTVSVLLSAPEEAFDAAQEATLNVLGTASFGSEATLKANLTLQAGATLEMQGPVHMGSTVTLTAGSLLGDALLNRVQTMLPGDSTTLFTGVDKLVLFDGTTGYTYLPGDLTAADDVPASRYFTNLMGDDYVLTFRGDGSEGDLAIEMVPEPATATLSLLALAALASRRRRK